MNTISQNIHTAEAKAQQIIEKAQNNAKVAKQKALDDAKSEVEKKMATLDKKEAEKKAEDETFIQDLEDRKQKEGEKRQKSIKEAAQKNKKQALDALKAQFFA